MHSFLSPRAWIIFIGCEAILAALLFAIGQPWLLLLTGVGLLAGLWMYDHPSAWLPAKARSALARLGTGKAISPNRIAFDYSTNDGAVIVGQGDDEFRVRFSKASNQAIYVYRGAAANNVARVKNKKTGEPIDFAQLDSSSSSYTIHLGEHFVLQNAKGHFLQARIVSIKDDSRGDDRDEVVFDYALHRTEKFLAI